ncbi:MULTISPECIES: SUMF1/EgtB/PvdO family nonheme iron enzyme [unclassified Modicisalibacter]|uniref:formylglycine-generating enzyme family protein n=1 Tax=unclassified Modicisalibacter TaxID=2679913 RepID=UPI001CC9EA1C|nr:MULTISPECIES: SUMF1/EgtB/PvdO family nonheme iron enzyme [unclassified Modicisalibacter]MBZ9559471.1 SUMF1/EgtB/PvdO family nonheme iron enzyme [Modicisalibacter sp. R2A 31.J]MBZ9576363.1 SUMF1/EgtB/PvdO family nonheme iron enzyme [Modicisalibacter sp. MOD 31.J]
MKPLVILTILSSLVLTACGDSSAEGDDPANGDNGAKADHQAAIDALLDRTEKHLVHVEGGSFQMGDFGPKDPKSDHLPWSFKQDDKHLHKVTLDGFYISDRQVTYADYDVYTQATGQPKINTDNSSSETRAPDVPAGVDWYQARDYCQWLAEQSGQPYALPTEAQWEYAARSRGKMLPYATDTGLLKLGENYPTREERRQASPADDPAAPLPVMKKYPPNPLGVYQMGLNGYEWVSDWYGEDYYEHSPVHNPTGPESGTLKVRRGGETSGGGYVGLVTVIRSPYNPDLALMPPEGVTDGLEMYANRKQPALMSTFRCVVNQIQ